MNNRAFNASAPGSFMMPNDFANDKGKKLFRKLWIKFSSRRKLAETGYGSKNYKSISITFFFVAVVAINRVDSTLRD